jgi:FkbM family methyltransferase
VGSRAVVDLGSSLGFVAAHAMSQMATVARIICVEANPTLIPSLKQTLTRHAGGREVVVVQAAIAYGASRVRMELGPQTTMGRLSATGVPVSAVTLSSVLSDNDVGEYCLLADIEGAERGILECDSVALARCQRAVLELHGSGATIEELIERFERLGLKLVDRLGPVVALRR